MKSYLYALALLPLGLLPSGGHAQTPPDAGSLMQQMEQSRPSLPTTPPGPEISPLPAPMRGLPGASVTVRTFRFVGNQLLSDAQLAPVVAPYLNRPLSFNELQQAAAAVGEAYRAAGWIVRVYVPRQVISEGVVMLQIVEAVFGKAVLDGVPLARVQTETITDLLGVAQKRGEPLDAAALDRALLLIEDLPGLTSTASLREGAAHGETDVVLKLADAPYLGAVVNLDNHGARSTGAPRVIAGLAVNSPLRRGDQATLDVIHSQGSDYLRLGFMLPVGVNGWRVGTHASRLDYRVVADEFASADLTGNSSAFGFDASYPLLRSRLSNLYLKLVADHKRFDNRAAAQTTSNYRVDSLTASLVGNRFDNILGGGASMASLSVVSGRVDLDGSPNQAADLAGPRSEGRYLKLTFAASRQQMISGPLSFYAAYSGQLAKDNLDSSEKFYLGGPAGVRAYPVNEAGGSSGQLLSLELRAKLPHKLTLAGFYDWGQVTVNSDNDFPGAAQLNRYHLEGAGLSLDWLSPFGVSFKATWAHRIGNNPNPTLAGTDQDGSRTLNRGWLSASLPI